MDKSAKTRIDGKGAIGIIGRKPHVKRQLWKEFQSLSSPRDEIRKRQTRQFNIDADLCKAMALIATIWTKTNDDSSGTSDIEFQYKILRNQLMDAMQKYCVTAKKYNNRYPDSS